MTISINDWKSFCRLALVAKGVAEDAADVQAQVLLFAEARGLGSHGLGLLPDYVANIEKGAVNPRPDMRVVGEGAAYALVDADNGLGAVAGVFATRVAIGKAQAAGVATVTVRNSNHFGAAAYYALAGAEAGMVAEVSSNAPPMMAPVGGRGRVLGNNPIAVAVPTGPGTAMVVDLALSKVSAGRIINAATAGEAIPRGWLLTPEGQESTDPNDYHAGGALVPLGEHKGYALALAVEALAGGLSGAGMATEVNSFRRTPDLPSRTGHLIRMTKIEAFMEREAFFARMADLKAMMESAGRVDDAVPILFPGERGSARHELALAEGLMPPALIIGRLRKMAAGLGIAFPA